MKLTFDLSFEHACEVVKVLTDDVYYSSSYEDFERLKLIELFSTQALPQLLAHCTGEFLLDNVALCSDLASDIKRHVKCLNESINNECK